jgi:hypothetical protein
MPLKRLIRRIFKALNKVDQWSQNPEDNSIYVEQQEAEAAQALLSVWDILRFRDNTQAYHLNGVLGFDEWVDMEEIRRRISEIFGAEYKNFRSLYPYLKTLVDLGLMETTSAGGRRKWRKVALLVSVKEKEAKKDVKKEIVIVNKKKKNEEN